MLKALVDLNVFYKAEFLDMFSVHTNTGGEAQINWRNPGTFNPTLVNNPVFTAYEGFTGDSVNTRYIRSNFIPSVDGTIIGQDNICVIIGVGTDLEPVNWQNAYDFGAGNLLIASRYAGNTEFFCNSAAATVANTYGKKYFGMSRNNAVSFDSYQNLVETNCVKTSATLTNLEIYVCAINIGGTAYICNRQLRFAFLFSYLTEAEITGTMGIMNTYLTNYGTNLY
jgi:hypothetical protein